MLRYIPVYSLFFLRLNFFYYYLFILHILANDFHKQRICSFDGVTSADALSEDEVVIGRLTIQKLRAELEVARVRDLERAVELEATNKKLRMTSLKMS